MKTTAKKLRPPIKRHGGKAYLARRIVGLFPPHRTYCEPFLGGGSVLLNKPPSLREVAGDADARLVELWTVLQDPIAILPSLAAELDYLEENFAKALGWLDSELSGMRALGYLVRNRFSRGGMAEDFAWSDRLRGKKREGGPVPGDVNAWDTIRAELPAIAERIRRVEFGCCDAVQLIQSVDGPETLHYLDPPYLHETRTAKAVYDHEMTRADHERLLAAILACKGRVFLSGYSHPLYDEALAGWKRHEFDMPNHSGQGKAKQRRIECLWESPA